jgi:hypothetical protein
MGIKVVDVVLSPVFTPLQFFGRGIKVLAQGVTMAGSQCWLRRIFNLCSE